MSLDFSSLKSISFLSLEDDNISKKNKEKKRAKKIIIQNLIKKQKREKITYQEIYRNKPKKLSQSKTTKDNTFTLTSESSINIKKYDKFVNKKSLEFPNEEKGNEANKVIKEDIKLIKNILYSNIDNNFKIKNNTIKLNDLRKYIFKMEKKIKDEEKDNILYQKSISDFMKEIDNLFARFSFFIFILLKLQKTEQAKCSFLLLLKENKKYLEYIEKSIIETYYTSKSFPKEAYELLRIYAFIIKYSQLLNVTYNCHIFLGRYFEIIYYIYNWFKYKENQRSFSINIKNKIKFWFSLALHNASYFSNSYYFPIRLSINLNKNIIDIYGNLDENNLSTAEKALIIKVLYNLSLSYYLNGQNDKALDNLYDAKDRIINNEDVDYSKNNIIYTNIKKKGSISLLSPYLNVKDNLSINNEDYGNRLTTANSCSDYNNFNSKVNNDNDCFNKLVDEEKVMETFSKDKINLEDIKLLINYCYKSGLIKECNNGNVNINNFSSKSKKLKIPKYLRHPLLRKIEILMGEIETDKKNYKSAYEHILKAFYIIILIKLKNKAEGSIQLDQEQKIIGKYLTLIEKLKEKEMENKNERKSENNSEENTLNEINQSLISNDNEDSNKEKYKEELGDIINDKYNLNLFLNKNNDRKSLKKEILVCGKKELDFKIVKDMEKFFIFLCSLSLHQLKVLNETQPDSWKRNDLPILFSSIFKDGLSNNQRTELDNLQTMSLNRETILKNPNGLIIPNNLNINVINQKDMKKLWLRQTFKFFNKFWEESAKEIQIRQKREFLLYQKIMRSGKLNRYMKEFFNNNFELVLKVLKNVNDSDLEEILDSPNILLEPIRKYKRKRKKSIDGNNIKNKSTKNYFSIDKNYIDYRMSTRGFGMPKMKLRLEKNNSIYCKHRINKKDNGQRLSCKKNKRNKSKLERNFHFQFKDDGVKKLDKRDYNDNYKESQISIDSSFYEGK